MCIKFSKDYSLFKDKLVLQKQVEESKNDFTKQEDIIKIMEELNVRHSLEEVVQS
jgi:hypothetical protein